MPQDQQCKVHKGGRWDFSPSVCGRMPAPQSPCHGERLCSAQSSFLYFLSLVLFPSLTDPLLGFSRVCASGLLTELHTDYLLPSVSAAGWQQKMCFCVPRWAFVPLTHNHYHMLTPTHTSDLVLYWVISWVQTKANFINPTYSWKKKKAQRGEKIGSPNGS